MVKSKREISSVGELLVTVKVGVFSSPSILTVKRRSDGSALATVARKRRARVPVMRRLRK